MGNICVALLAQERPRHHEQAFMAGAVRQVALQAILAHRRNAECAMLIQPLMQIFCVKTLIHEKHVWNSWTLLVQTRYLLCFAMWLGEETSCEKLPFLDINHGYRLHRFTDESFAIYPLHVILTWTASGKASSICCRKMGILELDCRC